MAIDSPEQFEEIETLLSYGFEQIRFEGRTGTERWNAARDQVTALLDRDRVIDTTAPSTPTFDFVALEDFYAAARRQRPDGVAAYQDAVDPPELDFHDAIQFLNQHPPLMRLLGLVYDLEVDVAGAPPPVGQALVSVRPVAGALGGTTVRRPRTRSQISATDFFARPRPGDHASQPRAGCGSTTPTSSRS